MYQPKWKKDNDPKGSAWIYTWYGFQAEVLKDEILGWMFFINYLTPDGVNILEEKAAFSSMKEAKLAVEKELEDYKEGIRANLTI